jgi:hypothetical protein
MADLQDLTQQQQQLAQQLADAAAAHRGLQQQVSALQDSKADSLDVRDMLAEGLKGKADSTAVNQIKAQLGDKANRSELDALLNALSSNAADLQDPTGTGTAAEGAGAAEGSAAPAASLAAASAPEAPGDNSSSSSRGASQAGAGDGGSALAAAGGGSSRRGTREHDAAGNDPVAQQLSKLQLQLAVLQDRVNKKVGVVPRLCIVPYAVHHAIRASS